MMKQKIQSMLKIYRERLKEAAFPPADYVACVQLQAQIAVLELLLIYAQEETQQQEDDVIKLRYWQHGETGRVTATKNDLDGEWYEIDQEAYIKCLRPWSPDRTPVPTQQQEEQR